MKMIYQVYFEKISSVLIEAESAEQAREIACENDWEKVRANLDSASTGWIYDYTELEGGID